MSLSPAQEAAHVLARLPQQDVDGLLAEQLTGDEWEALGADWRFWARPEQLAPAWPWSFWILVAGRAFGKTRSGAEFVIEEVEAGRVGRVALVGATIADARDVLVEGESGILACAKPWNRPVYEKSLRKITWPNGAQAFTYSAEEPDRLRGPQHHLGWCDEVAAWERMQETWNMFLMGLRLGARPRAVVTTTPRPLALLRELVSDPANAVTRGSTKDNAANLPPAYLGKILARYEGTRLGEQELDGKILDELKGALFDQPTIDKHRVSALPAIRRTVVSVDPAISTRSSSDQTGIVGLSLGDDRHIYPRVDRSGKYTPEDWGEAVVQLAIEIRADAIVCERNRGGDLVKANIRAAYERYHHKTGRTLTPVPIKEVHATRGKDVRAEPVSGLYAQGRVHHVGVFKDLEEEMTTWSPLEQSDTRRQAKSPNRLDALVWGAWHLADLGEEIKPDVPRGVMQLAGFF